MVVNKNNVKLSIVVCIYNSEKYISKLLDSIIGQTLKEIEVICVNDGSLDRSKDILVNYAKKDSRIQVVNQENQGSGMARTAGYKIATGEYIVFFDGDDWIDLKYCEKLYNKAKENDSDVIFCRISLYQQQENKIYNNNYYYNMGNIPEQYHNKSFSPIEGRDFIFDTNFEMWNKVCKLKFLRDNNIGPGKLKIFNDVVYMFKIFSSANKILFVPENLIYYRKHSNSMSSTINNNAHKFIGVFNIALEHMKKLSYYKKIKKQVLKRMVLFLKCLFLKKEDFISYKDTYLELKSFFWKNQINLTPLFKFRVGIYFNYYVVKYFSYFIYRILKFKLF